VSWEHAFPADRETYRSHQRKKEEDRERIRRLEEGLMKTQEVAQRALQWEQALKATMDEKIQKAVEGAVTSRHQSLSQLPATNISPCSAHLKNSCASTEAPARQVDDVGLRFPVDDVTAPLTSCEVEKTFICWRKQYIIIPGVPPPQPNPSTCGLLWTLLLFL